MKFNLIIENIKFGIKHILIFRIQPRLIGRYEIRCSTVFREITNRKVRQKDIYMTVFLSSQKVLVFIYCRQNHNQ